MSIFLPDVLNCRTFADQAHLNPDLNRCTMLASPTGTLWILGLYLANCDTHNHNRGKVHAARAPRGYTSLSDDDTEP